MRRLCGRTSCRAVRFPPGLAYSSRYVERAGAERKRDVQELCFPYKRRTAMLEMQSVRMEVPAETNIIVGQSHFIKTVEDLYEAVATTVPQAKFGVAFNESSGACLTRSEGNDQTLQDTAVRNAQT